MSTIARDLALANHVQCETYTINTIPSFEVSGSLFLQALISRPLLYCKKVYPIERFSCTFLWPLRGSKGRGGGIMCKYHVYSGFQSKGHFVRPARKIPPGAREQIRARKHLSSRLTRPTPPHPTLPSIRRLPTPHSRPTAKRMHSGGPACNQHLPMLHAARTSNAAWRTMPRRSGSERVGPRGTAPSSNSPQGRPAAELSRSLGDGEAAGSVAGAPDTLMSPRARRRRTRGDPVTLCSGS